MNNSKCFRICAILFSCLLATSASARLVHPGGWHTQEDLTLIRTKIAAREEPWITGWNAAGNHGPDSNFRTNPSRLITSNGAMHKAGMAAWVLTMKWVATGDRDFSDAAINVIDTWVRTVRDFDVYGPTLTISTGAGAMAQAAEILEHGFNGEAGWPRSDAEIHGQIPVFKVLLTGEPQLLVEICLWQFSWIVKMNIIINLKLINPATRIQMMDALLLRITSYSLRGKPLKRVGIKHMFKAE